jgi:hypothetical protein
MRSIVGITLVVIRTDSVHYTMVTIGGHGVPCPYQIHILVGVTLVVIHKKAG